MTPKRVDSTPLHLESILAGSENLTFAFIMLLFDLYLHFYLKQSKFWKIIEFPESIYHLYISRYLSKIHEPQFSEICSICPARHSDLQMHLLQGWWAAELILIRDLETGWV